MSYTDDRDYGREFACPYLAGRDFEEAIEKAQSLLEKGDTGSALFVLRNLERKYVRAVRLFDLLGTAHTRVGNLEDGTRCRSLHDELIDLFQRSGADDGAEEETREGERDADGMHGAEIGAPQMAGLFPVTAAMGHEFMRQGHFDRALEIFDALLVRNPDDDSLQQSRNEAHKKSRETKMLEFLKGWLGAIEKIRSQLSSSP
ncbi:MAG: hypothetical protein P8182_02280 [Deltaproteobacteria bacterium]